MHWWMRSAELPIMMAGKVAVVAGYDVGKGSLLLSAETVHV